MKVKSHSSDPAGHPPVLDLKPDLSRPAVQAPDPQRQADHKGQKRSR